VRRLTTILILALTFALGTAVAWWVLPVLAALAGAWLRRGSDAALAAVIAWGCLLLIDAVGGRFAALAASLGGVMGLPPAVLIVVTLAFAALLAWSAATLAASLRSRAGHTV
jgi:hypothetical protein